MRRATPGAWQLLRHRAWRRATPGADRLRPAGLKFDRTRALLIGRPQFGVGRLGFRGPRDVKGSVRLNEPVNLLEPVKNLAVSYSRDSGPKS